MSKETEKKLNDLNNKYEEMGINLQEKVKEVQTLTATITKQVCGFRCRTLEGHPQSTLKFYQQIAMSR